MRVLTVPDSDEIAALRERDQFFWLDLVDPAPDDLDAVGKLLGLHPLALEDTREFGQRPKVDVYEDNVLVVFYSVRVDAEAERIAMPIEVHVYVAGGFLLTVHRDASAALELLHRTLESEPIHDETFLVYTVFDALTDEYYPAIAAFEDRIDVLEGDVLDHPRREQLTHIYRLRQSTRELSRLVADQRDHFAAASEAIRELPGLTRGTREYLRDVGDHLAQVAEELQRQHDDLMALTGTYFNANSARLNAVAARLTVVGTLFVAWTLVTGFFGQNFGWLVDNIDSRTDFLMFGVGGLLIPTIAIGTYWAKRRDWF